jgi:hypothetical protein
MIKFNLQIHEIPPPLDDGTDNMTDEEAFALALLMKHTESGGCGTGVLLFDPAEESVTLRVFMPAGLVTEERIAEAKKNVGMFLPMAKMAGMDMSVSIKRADSPLLTAVALH